MDNHHTKDTTTIGWEDKISFTPQETLIKYLI